MIGHDYASLAPAVSRVESANGGIRCPVRLYSDGEDPRRRRLHIQCLDQVGLLFKLFEVLRSQSIDICGGDIMTVDGIVNNRFDLYVSQPADFADATDWCRELEEFLSNPASQRAAMLQGSLDTVMRKLSVNRDLLSVVSFQEISIHDGPPDECRYTLEIQGINQAGLLTFASVIFFRSGFNVVKAKISTHEGHVTDSFELSTTSPDAEKKLGSFLDLPMQQVQSGSAAMPFHACASDNDLGSLVNLWRTNNTRPFSPCSSFSEDQAEDGSVAGAQSTSTSSVRGSGQKRVEDMSNLALPINLRSRIGSGDESELPSKLGSPKASQDMGTGSVPLFDGDCSISLTRQSDSGSVTGKKQHMSVNFENGDMYTGQSVLFETGEKRHGYGTYYYSDATHPIYKQYQGEWREDQKHGYGVLFFKKGGVYVGQWQNNKKHGLGVLHESNDERQTSMPSSRYEGQWCEDEPHGLGVEETRESSYFGRFNRGKRQGRGIRMNHKSMGFNSCFLVDTDIEMPLHEAMQAELQRLRPSHNMAGHGDIVDPRGCCHHTEPNRQDAQEEDFDIWPQADRFAGGQTGSESSGSSAKTSSGETKAAITPMGRHLELVFHGSPLDSATPQLLAGGRSIMPDGSNNHHRGPVLPISSTTPHSGAIHQRPEMIIAMMEENNLISPDETLIQQNTSAALPQVGEEDVCQPEAPPACQPQESGSVPAARQAARPCVSDQNQSHGRDCTEDKRVQQGASGSSMGKAMDAKHGGGPSGPVNRRLCSPMLWSQAQLAAFVSCLGISSEVSLRILQGSLKGVVHFLELSNSELRRDFGLASPVERLMLRQSLKWLLDADRCENCFYGQRIGDILKDSVLSQYVIPFEEVTLHGKISQGGYGMVYRGLLEPRTNRAGLQAGKVYPIAAKEMKGERRARLYELLKEACIMASLHHPNVCTFLGVAGDATARKHYIISELMDCSLHDLVHQPYKLRWHGELTVSLVVDLSVGICTGIVYLHSMKLVHADLKSSNILISYTMSWELIPRICDFGHAAMRSFPSPHHRCGTPHWAAPEVLRSEALGPAADVYSFGVIVWEMLTQRIPHRGLSFAQVLAAVGWAGWGPDLKLLPDIPLDLKRLIKSCLRFIAAERPDTLEVQKRLRRIPRRARLAALSGLLAFLGGCGGH